MTKLVDKKRIASLIVFAFGILMVLYYIIVSQRVEFDSDFTDTVLWAEAMLTGNGIFDKTMSYAYTLPFGGSLLMAPFVAIFGVSYKAHALGFVLFLAIFVYSLYKLLKKMDFSTDMSLFATGLILLLSLPTKNVRMIMWGHVIHYSLGLLFVIIALNIYSKIDVEKITIIPDKKKGEKFCFNSSVIALAITTALFCTNGLTILLFFAIPFYGALFVERLIDVSQEEFCKENISSALIVLICGGCGFIGFVISKILQRGVTTVYDGMFKTIPMWQSWVWDITEKIRCFVVLTAGTSGGEVAMESFSGIRILVMAFVAFVYLILPFAVIASYKHIENKIIKLYAIAYFILFFSSLFIYDFSTAKGTPHRIVGLYMTSVIVCVIFALWLLKSVKLRRFGILLITLFFVAGLFGAYGALALRGQNRYEKLADVLQENNLKYGYADYWSAQVTTVLSDSKVEICPVTVREDGTLDKRMYNIRAQQFEDKDGVDRYFVFMSDWEYETTRDTIGKDAMEVISFDEDGYILVFNHNLF